MKTFILLTLLQIGASSADFYYTDRNLHSAPFHERNPIAAPFWQSTAGGASYTALTAGINIGGAWWLRRHHHNKLALAVQINGVAQNAAGAAYSAVNHRDTQRH